MKVAHLIGRILLAGFLLTSSITNLLEFPSTVAYTQSMGVPYPRLASLVAMIILLLGGASILTGILPRAGIALMMVFLVPVTLLMHQFWNTPDPTFSFIQLKFFTENIGLLGAMIMFLSIPTPWPYSLKLSAPRTMPVMVAEPEKEM